MKQHILVISQYFYPEEFRINDICKEWIKKGYQVTVITGIPNYPVGSFFKGYGFRKKREEMYEGIRIIRLPILPRGKNAVTLVLNYLSYVVSGFFWKCFTNIRADRVFIFEVSPMTQALVGIWYAKRLRIPCYIYVQDLWPENVQIVTGLRNKSVLGMINRMVDYIYKNCNRIFATSPSFVKRLESRESVYQDGKSKVIYWPQYAESFYHPVKKRGLQDVPVNDKFKIVFTGNIGYAQGLDILPRTARILREKQVACEFIIIGDGRYKDEFVKEVKANNVGDMFVLPGRKKPEDIPEYLAWCNVAFLSLADEPLFEMTIPAKLQSYMACGKPILAVAGGEIDRIIKASGCGICIRNRDAAELAAVIEQMMADTRLEKKGKNALEYYEKHFSKEYLIDKGLSYIFNES